MKVNQNLNSEIKINTAIIRVINHDIDIIETQEIYPTMKMGDYVNKLKKVKELKIERDYYVNSNLFLTNRTV